MDEKNTTWALWRIWAGIGLENAMFSPNGMMPKRGPQVVLKLERATNDSVGSKAVNLSKTYTNVFVAKADKKLHIK